MTVQIEPSSAVATRSDVGVGTTAEALVSVLVAQGVEIIFLNPGTDTAPVQEALLALAERGYAVPRVVMCPHEAVALAAAHGYFAKTGRPQVVMVHVDVGTQNLGSMVHNAFRANTGVIVIAGRTPETAYGEEAGGRDSVVHWMQDVPDQAGLVRSYVKWTADLSTATMTRQIARAFQVAASAPCGPVYLTAVRELLMRPAPADFAVPAPGRYGPPAAPAPDPDTLRRAAQVLAGSAAPVIVTARAGQHVAAVAELVAIAELIGAVVVDTRERVNFPSDHPCYLTDAAVGQAALRAADAVLVVDCPVPWVPQVAAPAESATVISLELDPIHSSMPAWFFPVDIGIQCDPLSGLRGLLSALRAVSDPTVETRWRQRRDALLAGSAIPTPQARPPVDGGSPEPVSVPAVARALNELLVDEDIVVEEATTNSEVLRSVMRRTVPGTFFRSGGSGLGWGLGAALGVKLAAPGARVMAIVGDGSFLFSSPAAALWAISRAPAPVVVLVLQNGGYAASRRPVFELFPDGSSTATGTVIGTLFDSPPDFAALAEACGARGEHIRHEAELRPALRRALDAVEQGRSSVLVAHVPSPWI